MTISGKETETTVSDVVFGLTNNPKLVAQAVRVFLSNQRLGLASTKNRGEIEKTKKKWYKQKHTGGARHGARSAPIFVGGGVTHGPHGNQNWDLKLNKKMRKRALQTAFALQAKEGNVMSVEGLETVKPKTKDVVTMLKKMNLSDARILIVIQDSMADLLQASRNVGSVLCTRVDRVNPYEVMSAHKILITPQAMGMLEEKFSGKTEQEAGIVEAPKKRTRKVAAKKTE